MALAPDQPIDDDLTVYLDTLDLLEPVTLEEVLASAELTTRLDQKYLVPYEALPDVVAALPESVRVLEIAGQRSFGYESVYFDSDCFALYHRHAHGRRKRYKVRTRTYLDSGDTMFEVKLKGLRGATFKERLPYDGKPAELNEAAHGFVDNVVNLYYDESVPVLAPRITTTYTRTTLVDVAAETRVTVDLDLAWSDGEAESHADRLALIETKTRTGAGPIDRALLRQGVRPVQLSKYCIGVALLHPELAANRWNRLLVQNFGWRRQPVDSTEGRSAAPESHQRKP